MRFYKKLRKEDTMKLPINSLVYITMFLEEGTFTRVPSFVTGNDGNSICVFQNMDIQFRDIFYDLYEDIWYVEVEDGFTVDTPDGTLHATDAGGGEEYPGIRINLHRDGDEYPISLSMTEYISGGEGFYGYDPAHPARAQEEYDEVPVERIVDRNGNPIASKKEVTVYSGHKVTAGLVSRAWPDEIHDEDYHKRVFHIGYKDDLNEEV